VARSLPVDTAGTETVSAVEWQKEARIHEHLAAINSNAQLHELFARRMNDIRKRQALASE